MYAEITHLISDSRLHSNSNILWRQIYFLYPQCLPSAVKYRITGGNKFLSLPKRGSDFRGYQTNHLKVLGYLMLGVPFPHCVLGVPVYLGVPKIFGGTSNLIIYPVRLPLSYKKSHSCSILVSCCDTYQLFKA